MRADSLIIPRPVQLVIDDVGWREGWDISGKGGPFRAGVDRLLGPADYAAIAEVGEALGVRPQAAMILCEWDRRERCAACPTSTHQGEGWSNVHRIGPWLEQSVSICRERAAHLEFALHGVGHEHWEDGMRTRAEWLGQTATARWPRAVLDSHWHCFRQIMADNGLGADEGVSQPESFVPCAFRFLWDNADDLSTGAVMSDYGLRFASTPFSTCLFPNDAPAHGDGGFEHDLLVLDRGNSGVPWYAYDTTPADPPSTAVCGIHWPNLLRPDPEENAESTARWVRWLGALEADPKLMLARSMAETCSQWLWNTCASVTSTGPKRWRLHLNEPPRKARDLGILQPIVLKLPWPGDATLPSVRLSAGNVVGCWRKNQSMMLALQPTRDQAAMDIELTSAAAFARGAWVSEPGTCDLLAIKHRDDAVELAVRVYGSQRIALQLPFEARDIDVQGDRVRLVRAAPAAPPAETSLVIATADLQGRKATIRFRA